MTVIYSFPVGKELSNRGKPRTDDHWWIDGIRPGWRAFLLWETYPQLFPSSCHMQMAYDLERGLYGMVEFASRNRRRVS